VGDRSPGSREAEGEGGEGFISAQSGRCPDLLVIGGEFSTLVNSSFTDAKSSLSSLEMMSRELPPKRSGRVRAYPP
jgi:hypothetical protein